LPRPELDEARLLLRKACEDGEAVDKLAADVDIADAIVGFHAQQAAEKALKAVLAASGDDFPWTHDLRHLVDRVTALGTRFPEMLAEIRVLSPWAVEFRYGETIDDPLDRKQAVALVDGVIDWAIAEIEGELPAPTQPLTASDQEAGIMRVPSESKGLLPAERCRIKLVLRGCDLGEVRWDPRLGPDRERSGVLGIRQEAATTLTEGEILHITRVGADVHLD
jgi:HEPN domain-containing protein